MQTRRFLLPMVGFMLAGGALAFAFAADEEKRPDAAAMKKQLHELLYKRVETAQRYVETMQAAYEAETVVLGELTTAMNSLLEAKLAVARTPQEEIAALEEHLTHAKQVERKIELLYDVGSKGGEANQYALAKFNRESAEIELLKARLKTKQ